MLLLLVCTKFFFQERELSLYICDIYFYTVLLMLGSMEFITLSV